MHESILNLCPIEFNAQLVVMNAPARADNAMFPGVVSGRAHARNRRYSRGYVHVDSGAASDTRTAVVRCDGCAVIVLATS